MSQRPSSRDREPSADETEQSGSFTHAACFYADAVEYVAAVVPFLREGLAAGDGAFVAVPAGNLRLLRDALGADAERVSFMDMTSLGANPARIIPAIQGFLDESRGRRVSFVGEPIWPARCACELREATRHESLINLAFTGQAISILCPYDVTRLAPAVIDDAERTHPVLLRDGREDASRAYGGRSTLPPSCDGPLTDPPVAAEAFAFSRAGDLARLRHRLADRARVAGFDPGRIADIELAISEVMTNTLRYGGSTGGTVRIWSRGDRLLCQVDDTGRMGDPLAGRRIPGTGSVGGWGLVLANKLCDLVEIRSAEAGTTVRLHMTAGEVATAA